MLKKALLLIVLYLEYLLLFLQAGLNYWDMKKMKLQVNILKYLIELKVDPEIKSIKSNTDYMTHIKIPSGLSPVKLSRHLTNIGISRK